MNATESLSSSRVLSFLELKFLPLFYLVPPSHSSFKTLREVPNYLDEVRRQHYLLIFIFINFFMDLKYLQVGLVEPRFNSEYTY